MAIRKENEHVNKFQLFFLSMMPCQKIRIWASLGLGLDSLSAWEWKHRELKVTVGRSEVRYSPGESEIAPSHSCKKRWMDMKGKVNEGDGSYSILSVFKLCILHWHQAKAGFLLFPILYLTQPFIMSPVWQGSNNQKVQTYSSEHFVAWSTTFVYNFLKSHLSYYCEK